MALVYDLKTDIRYLQGYQVGLKKGFEKYHGRKMNKEELTEIIENLVELFLSVERIAYYLDVPLDLVKEVHESMKDKKIPNTSL